MTSAHGDAAELSAQLSEHMNGFLYSAALYTVTLHGVADHLAGGPRSPEELGELTGLHGPHLGRVLRYLSTRQVFQEDAEGRFALTPMAELLRAGVPGSLRDSFLMLGDDLYWKPVGRLHETVRTGRTAFDEIFGAPFFAHLQTDPAAASLFNAGTAGFSHLVTEHVAQSCDFPDGATVVDVGGGRGGLLRSVLAAHPQVTGTLYDQASVIAEHQLDHPEVAGRWATASGDFFESVPAGHDHYLLKSILHDWSDENCLRILQAVRAGMRKDSKLLVVDPVIPPGNAFDASKTIDVMMMAVYDGKERTQREFEEILTKAGFKITRILPTPSLMSVIEAVIA
ncbi:MULTISPECIES: methyltransferase [Streptomyces]|uniref:methyltransferase n=1 Tax=Streptomyces TaxID=1883 RepID=UPI002020B7AD|nr:MULTISPECIES: methyltransferase [Streptomyces]MCL7495554.1 SAM-dependent methyltransferase [Streptomyces sp. MCA2]